MKATGNLVHLYEALQAGKISRRTFLRQAATIGVATPVALFLLNGLPGAAAQAQPSGSTRPTSGTQSQQRGEGGELKILQWQAPTTLNPHLATGDKDVLAAQPVLEPLMSYMPDGSSGTTLVKEVPSVANGLLAKDFTSVTYNLLDGVTWSDGQPFTAKDVVFTWQWVMNPDNQSINYESYRPIKNVEALSDTQVKITFNESRLDWYVPFSGAGIGPILPEHILSQGKDAVQAFGQKPIGTGPFVVDTFKANDQVTYVVNDKYREPNKPYFSRVNLKGGGDPASAARAVLQTGGWDYGWNIQVEPEIIKSLEQGGKGKVYVSPGRSTEHIRFNFSDPNKEVDGQRSYWKQPHPFLTDKAVREALAMASDSETIAKEFYMTPIEHATPNIVNGFVDFTSKNTKHVFDIDQAKKVLDDAGWVMKDGVRQKDGVKLQLTFATTINSVRQKEQAVIKKGWEELGVKVQLKQIDAGIFFDTSAGNDQGDAHFYTDVMMYTRGPATPFPLPMMQDWYSNNGENISQKENGWLKQNNQRYNNPAYDKLYESAGHALNTEAFAQLMIQMNDLLIDDVAVVPLVNRAAGSYALANTMNNENIGAGPGDYDYWNIANWNRTTKS